MDEQVWALLKVQDDNFSCQGQPISSAGAVWFNADVLHLRNKKRKMTNSTLILIELGVDILDKSKYIDSLQLVPCI